MHIFYLPQGRPALSRGVSATPSRNIPRNVCNSVTCPKTGLLPFVLGHSAAVQCTCQNCSTASIQLICREWAGSKAKLHLQHLTEATVRGRASLLTPTSLPHRCKVCTPTGRYAIQMAMWGCGGDREEEEHEGCIPFGCFTGLTMFVGFLETSAARNRISQLSQGRDENESVFFSCRKLQNHAERYHPGTLHPQKHN